MKIALVCFNLSWQAGGVRLIYEEAHALKRLGHTVALYTPEFDEQVYPELRQGIDIRIVRPERPLTWQYASKGLLSRISEKREQVRRMTDAAHRIAAAIDADTHLVNLHDFAYRVAPFLKLRNPQMKVVWYMADPPYQYLPKTNILYDLASRMWNACTDIVERKAFAYIDAAVTLVKRNKAWLEARGVRTSIVWTGIDAHAFFAPVRTIQREQQLTLMSVGALNKYRRFEDAVEAVRILREEGRNVRLVVVCKNIWEQDAYLAELKQFIAERKLESYVELLPHGASEDELKKLYATSHIFVLPIHLPPPRNGFGWQMVAFEALVAGLPLIVCNTNDVTEALKDGETALTVDPMRPDQIVEKVKMLMDNPELYKKIVTAGQEFVRKNMSWEKFAQGIIDAASKSSL
jgi:glycosyltransferase involved in cell wall biosynthesis